MEVASSSGKNAPFFATRPFYRSLALLFFWYVMCSRGKWICSWHRDRSTLRQTLRALGLTVDKVVVADPRKQHPDQE
jgi:hypothetical protein